MATPLSLLPKIRSDQIMSSASGQPCSLRISSFVPGHSCSPASTTVGAHLPVMGKGMSTKVTDLAVVYACQHCHDILDGRDSARSRYVLEHYPAGILDRMLNALVETHSRLVLDGIIVVPDGEFR